MGEIGSKGKEQVRRSSWKLKDKHEAGANKMSHLILVMHIFIYHMYTGYVS